jgi:hypothetical protein
VDKHNKVYGLRTKLKEYIFLLYQERYKRRLIGKMEK